MPWKESRRPPQLSLFPCFLSGLIRSNPLAPYLLGLLERQASFRVAAKELPGPFLQDAGKDTVRILAAEAAGWVLMAQGNILHSGESGNTYLNTWNRKGPKRRHVNVQELIINAGEQPSSDRASALH